jgi:hypothetical protein
VGGEDVFGILVGVIIDTDSHDLVDREMSMI